MVPISVRSIAEEDRHLGACPCGGSWKLAAEDVVPLGGRWYDALVMKCQRCGDYGRGIFDITSFYPRPHPERA